MFCSKCGNELSSSDKFCKKCGSKNLNFEIVPTDQGKGKEKQGKEEGLKADKKLSDKKSPNRKTIAIVLLAASILVGVIVLIFLFGKIGGGSQKSGNKVTYTKSGIAGIRDTDGNISFIENGEIMVLEGDYTSAASSPDRQKIVALTEENVLKVFDASLENETVVAEKVERYSKIANQLFFYENSHGKVFCYDFEKGESTETDLPELSSLDYSANRNTAAGITKKGTLVIYHHQDGKTNTISNVGSDAAVICVSDDGKTVFWEVEEDKTHSIYTMVNGAPERIGKIKCTENYAFMNGYFVNGGKTCILYCFYGNCLLIYQDGQVSEITLPGKIEGGPRDENGVYVDSEDDILKNMYLILSQTKKGGDLEMIYKVSLDGNLTLITDQISYSYCTSNAYLIRNNKVYYVDKNGDLYVKAMEDEASEVLITTEVNGIYAAETGKYLYIIKSGGLYYWSKEGDQMTLISSDYDEDALIYMTDKEDTIYYIRHRKEITGSYSKKGTLYRYVVGSEPISLCGKAMDLVKFNGRYYSADFPLIRRYVETKDDTMIYEYGTIENDSYKEIITGSETAYY